MYVSCGDGDNGGDCACVRTVVYGKPLFFLPDFVVNIKLL